MMPPLKYQVLHSRLFSLKEEVWVSKFCYFFALVLILRVYFDRYYAVLCSNLYYLGEKICGILEVNLRQDVQNLQLLSPVFHQDFKGIEMGRNLEENESPLTEKFCMSYRTLFLPRIIEILANVKCHQVGQVQTESESTVVIPCIAR